VPDARAPIDVEDPVISIGVLAARVALSVSAVRRYENEGLIIAHRTDAGHRLFSHADIDRVRNIQHLVRDLGLNLEAIRRLQALLPCWELRPCDAETRAGCPAYGEEARPCWSIKGLHCAQQGNACRTCVVYRFGSLSTEEIKRLVHDQADLEGTDSAIRDLLERKHHLHHPER
jgi:MerR family transcriptional regulator/heat shock protein HspR